MKIIVCVLLFSGLLAITHGEVEKAPIAALPKSPATSEVSHLSVRDWLERLSFLAAIATAGVAFFGLRQLKIASASLQIAQEDIRIRCKREAVILAAQRCEDFEATKFAKMDECETAFNAKDVPLVRWKLVNNNFDSTSIQDQDKAREWLKAVKQNQLFGIAGVWLNQFESFSIYFSAEIADEEVAFPVIGKILCDHVTLLAPILIAIRTESLNELTSGSFPHTVRLYSIWADRLKGSQLEVQRRAIEKDINALNTDIIRPIGTDSVPRLGVKAMSNEGKTKGALKERK